MRDHRNDRHTLALTARQKGEEALAQGDHVEAMRWLDRARRVSGGDPGTTALLASLCLSSDPARAASLFVNSLYRVDRRESWCGLAAARMLLGDAHAAGQAMNRALSRHEPDPVLEPLADRVVALTGAPGWCGLMRSGEVVVRGRPDAVLDIRLDGKRVDGLTLPGTWKKKGILTVTDRGAPLLGSPIDVGAIAEPQAIRTVAEVMPETSEKPPGPGVILLTHDQGGGVERRVLASAAAHESRGRRPIVVAPATSRGLRVRLGLDDRAGQLFELPGDAEGLTRLLRETQPEAIEIHHFLRLHPAIFDVLRALALPYEVHLHDFLWFCPRIALVGIGDKYCGEPGPEGCAACLAKKGGYLPKTVTIPALLERSRGILAGASRVIAPSADTASRFGRAFPGLEIAVVPHEDDSEVPEPPPIPATAGHVKICLAGAIGLHKGYRVLLACARDARKRGLDLSFVVVGHTIGDQALLDEGVFVTGEYAPDEAADLIRAQGATLGFHASIWPETWCLGLTELWRAGLRTAAFDIGAPADRIRATGRGFLMPLGLPPAKINNALMDAVRSRSTLPIRRPRAYKTAR